MILTDIGEVGVHVGERVYVLRPSLYAMSRLGEPSEIVGLFSSVMSDSPSLVDALSVLYACADDDISEVFGLIDGDGEKIAYQPGQAESAQIIPLSRCLLRHGITGALPPLPRSADEEPEYVQEFDARAHVALAMAHLGVSERDAWQMTMTSLVGALRAKFPANSNDSPGSRAPSVEETEATLEWHDRVLAAREKMKG
jgi:hypothetical protein